MMQDRRPNRWLDGLAVLAAVGGGYGMVRCFRDGVREMDGGGASPWIWLWGALACLTAAAGIALYWRKGWSRYYFAGWGIVGGALVLFWALARGDLSSTGGKLLLGLRMTGALLLLGIGIGMSTHRVGQIFEEDVEKVDE